MIRYNCIVSYGVILRCTNFRYSLPLSLPISVVILAPIIPPFLFLPWHGNPSHLRVVSLSSQPSDRYSSETGTSLYVLAGHENTF